MKYQNCLSDTPVEHTVASQLWEEADSASGVYEPAILTWPVSLWAYLN